MKKDKKNSFNTPEGYFENFHERLMDKIGKEESQLESIIPKSDGFALPEGYFNSVTEKVLSKTTESEAKVIQLTSYRKFYYGAAAIAAIFLLVFGLNWKSEIPIDFEDLANTEIDAYFETTEIDMSTYELAELVPLDHLELNDMLENDIEAENILEYLDENVEDIEDLNLDYNDYE
ncbi:hypothetical protein J0X14_08830 [Muricauda sp. CAU 1633]|uniref:hypothetical protein n=1 Tax=Allomuricauda sp. CAU 1633 TaxID=2816036 RepID=UPI001A8DBFDC|nr:hypothetical protein [Muricauda sp. CAU 1633]MBO0322399.1 hypothetical protein [Muricauda sp. CAU 1633]